MFILCHENGVKVHFVFFVDSSTAEERVNASSPDESESPTAIKSPLRF
jgi:hypothetical protein